MTHGRTVLAAGAEPWIRWGLDGMFLALAIVGAVRAGTDTAVLVATGLVAWELVGALRLRSRGAGSATAWLVVLTVAWAGVTLAGQVEFAWLAFPLFFFQLFILPFSIGLLAVAATAIAAIIGLDVDGNLGATDVLGPTVGALVAVGVTMAYRAVVAENRRNRELLDELGRARDRLADTERQRGVLEERRRLAREVHDTIAQGLASIVLLARADGMSSQRDPQRITQIGEIAQQNLDEARRIVTALGPTSADATLRREIEMAVQTASRSSPTEFELRVIGDVSPLSVDSEFALLRVAQGALANVVAHAHASAAHVTLTYMEGKTVIEVEDDGVGFDPAMQADHDGSRFGLRIMHERIDAVAGALEIISQPGAGTTVRATIPRASA